MNIQEIKKQLDLFEKQLSEDIDKLNADQLATIRKRKKRLEKLIKDLEGEK